MNNNLYTQYTFLSKKIPDYQKRIAMLRALVRAKVQLPSTLTLKEIK